MGIIIPIFIATYVIQLVWLFATITSDIHWKGVLPKQISRKKQVLEYILPFGFLYAFYNYYKKLN